MNGLITFKMEVVTRGDEIVKIAGNHPLLGDWNADEGLELTTNEISYPIWFNQEPLILPKDTRIEFKCVIYENNQLKRWECLPNDSNRKYKVRYHKVQLKGAEGKAEGKEIIQEKNEHDANEIQQKDDYDNQAQQESSYNDYDNQNYLNNRNSSYGLNLNENTKYQKMKNSGIWNPFMHADFADSDESYSDIQIGLSQSCEFLLEKRESSEKMISKKKKQDHHLPIADAILQDYKENDSNNSSEVHSPVIQKNILMKHKSISTLYTNLKENLKTFNKIPIESQKVSKKFSQDSQQNLEFLEDIHINFNKNQDFVLITSIFLPIMLKKIDLQASDISSKYELENNYNFYCQKLVHLFQQAQRKIRKIVFVGILMGFPEEFLSNQDLQKELSQYLQSEYKCIAIFMDSQTQQEFLQKSDVNNIFSRDYQSNSLEESWSEVKQITQIFVDKLLSNLKDETNFIVILDYQLSNISSMISTQYKSVENLQIAQYYQNQFPCYESFCSLSYYMEILGNLLCNNIIIFDEFSHARQLFSILSASLGIKYESHKGHLKVQYCGREILIKIQSFSLSTELIGNIKGNQEFLSYYDQYYDQYDNQNIILSIDNLENVADYEFKLKLFREFIQENYLRYQNIKFIQILKLTTASKNFDKDKLDNISQLKQSINSIREGLLEIIEIEEQNKDLIICFMSFSQVLLFSQLKNTSNQEQIEFIIANEKYGICLVNELNYFNNICKSIYKFNLFNINDFKNKLNQILNMKKDITKFYNQQDFNYFQKNNTIVWISKVVTDLKKSKNIHNNLQKIIFQDENNIIKIVATNHQFYKMDYNKLVTDYLKSQVRLIIFDYEGTLIKWNKAFESYHKINQFNKNIFKLSDIVIKCLKRLASDPKNLVYIVTGKQFEYFQDWYQNIKEVGIACEFGLILKENHKKKWKKLFNMDWSWKEVVKKIMENYKERTEGSVIELKQSSCVWKYSLSQEEYGRKQAFELVSDLKSILEHMKDVDVYEDTYSVEVRPSAVTKGMFIELLLNKAYQDQGKIDFILAVGDENCDDEMFSRVKICQKLYGEIFDQDNLDVYLTLVGIKPSNANYYLKNVEEVVDLLEELNKAYL